MSDRAARPEPRPADLAPIAERETHAELAGVASRYARTRCLVRLSLALPVPTSASGTGGNPAMPANDDGRWELADPDLMYADRVKPGMVIHHPHGGSGVAPARAASLLDVLTVAGPDAEGFVYLTSPYETVRVVFDWPCRPYTAADADLEAFLLAIEPTPEVADEHA